MVVGSATAAKAGQSAWTEALKPLQADLLVIRKTVRSRRKKGTPTDLEFHLNPLGIGIAAVGGALALWLMQLRVQPREEAQPDGTYKKRYGVQERSGFLGNGSGTETGSPIGAPSVWSTLFGGWWSPWW